MSITLVRCGFASNASGPTFVLLAGITINPAYSDKFLHEHGAALHSKIIMTPTAFLTDEAWKLIVPHLIEGLRHVVRCHAEKLGIDRATADQLLIGLTFDGFKCHLKNFAELINMASKNILALVENRDSSEINQAFDRFVARAGKRRAAICLDQFRRSHISPIIDQWTLVLVGLAMLRDCSQSNVWENSFVAVNMHPHYRVPFCQWLEKIAPFVNAAAKFEREEVDERAMLPADWRQQPLAFRQKCLKIIDDEGADWNVELIAKLRQVGMALKTVANMFRIYAAEKRMQAKPKQRERAPAASTPPAITPNKMIYHVYNPNVEGMSPIDKFWHAVTVRNRTLGPDRGTTVSPHLDVEVSEDNKRLLCLKPEDVNMHRVLRESTCRAGGKRRKVARRILNALGGMSGYAHFVNDPDQVREIEQNMKFAQSLEAVKHAERDIKARAAKEKRDKAWAQAIVKMGLASDSKVFQEHVVGTKLTIPQMKAVAFVECGEVITGNAAAVRRELIGLLPKRPAGDETDDDLPPLLEVETSSSSGTESSSESGDESTEEEAQCAAQQTMANMYIDISVRDMTIGETVEVYWQGEKRWYEADFDPALRQFTAFYFVDEEHLVHNEDDYKVRMSV